MNVCSKTNKAEIRNTGHSYSVQQNRLGRYGHVLSKDVQDWVKKCTLTFEVEEAKQ